MGRLTQKGRRQDAVLWAIAGRTKFNKPKLSSPVAIKVRWENRLEETLDANNQVIRTEATVNVDREIAVGSILWQGKLKDLPGSPTDLYQVVQGESIPDVNNRGIRRNVRLIRFGDTLPDLA